MISVAHKIKLVPTNKQVTYFKKACGVARFTWNWGLDHWNKTYLSNKELPLHLRRPLNGMSLKKEFNSIKKSEFPWMYEVTKYASQQPFIQLDQAFKRFFKRLSNKPKFKKKNKSTDSFYIVGDQIKVHDKKVSIPLLGDVKLSEKLRFDGKIRSATISRTADFWFISIQVDICEKTNTLFDQNESVIGVDLGINTLAQFSNGLAIIPPSPLAKALRKLKRLQRKLKKKNFNSKNYLKFKTKIQKLHYRIACIRKDNLHKISSFLTDNNKTTVIENLNVSGMLKNHKLSRNIADMGFYEFRRQLEYKAKMKGGIIHIAGRFYPSSKECFQCKEVNHNLLLSDRIFICGCGFTIDRDLNAALNLEGLVNKKILLSLRNLRLGK